jgi:hypothetical protein
MLSHVSLELLGIKFAAGGRG